MNLEGSLGNFKSRVFHLLAWLLTEGEGGSEWCVDHHQSASCC